MALVLVGRIAGAFGVRGEVRVRAYGEDPLRLLSYGPLLDAGGREVLRPTGGRVAKGELVCRAEGVGDRDRAEALRGIEVFVPRERLPPPDEEEYYLVDLIGLAVAAPDGAPLGAVRAVHNFGAGDILEIEPAVGASFYLPFTRAAVPEVDLAGRRLVAVVPEAEDDPEPPPAGA